MRRLLAVLSTVAVVAGALGGAGSTPASAAADRPAWVSVPRWFSPNGDGVADTAVVRFTLAQPQDRVTLTFRTGRVGYVDNVRRVVLKDLDAGAHEWAWNGRDGSGKRVAEAEFKVTLQGDTSGVTASDRTQVDTSFAPTLAVATTYGAEDRTATVWPRSTAVTDALGLVAALHQRSVPHRIAGARRTSRHPRPRGPARAATRREPRDPQRPGARGRLDGDPRGQAPPEGALHRTGDRRRPRRQPRPQRAAPDLGLW